MAITKHQGHIDTEDSVNSDFIRSETDNRTRAYLDGMIGSAPKDYVCSWPGERIMKCCWLEPVHVFGSRANLSTWHTYPHGIPIYMTSTLTIAVYIAYRSTWHLHLLLTLNSSRPPVRTAFTEHTYLHGIPIYMASTLTHRALYHLLHQMTIQHTPVTHTK